jgi:hypothetical protein
MTDDDQERLEEQMNIASIVSGRGNIWDAFISDRISNAISILLAEKGLYQNVRITHQELDQYANDMAGDGAGPDDVTQREEEYRQRPWKPVSRNTGNTTAERIFWANVNAGTDPLGSPRDEKCLSFVMPQIETWCPACDKVTAFSSMPSSIGDVHGSGFPQHGVDTVQVLYLHYKCGLCSKQRLFYLEPVPLRLTC